jgi:hypothetical protein
MFANYLAFTTVKRSGVYRLYSRYPGKGLACETKSLRGVVRFLRKWMDDELRRIGA